MISELRPEGTRRSLALEVTTSNEVLARVLGLLLRRRCRVTGVDYVARDRHYPGRLVVAFEAPPGRARCVEAGLGKLVEVLAVQPAAVSRPGSRDRAHAGVPGRR